MSDASFFWRERIDRGECLNDRELKATTTYEEFKAVIKAKWLQGQATSEKGEAFFWDEIKHSDELAGYLTRNKARIQATGIASSIPGKPSKTYAKRGAAVFYGEDDFMLEQPKQFYVYKSSKTYKDRFKDVKTGRFAKRPIGYMQVFVYEK